MANVQLQVKFTTNRLGTQNLVHIGFKFQTKNRRRDRTYWKCSTINCPATINTHNNLPTKVADYHNHPADHMTLKVDDVLQQMKTRCRNELTLVPAIYEEQLVKLRHTEWNEETKQLVEHMHVQLFSSVEASTSFLACFQCFLLSSFYLVWIMLRLIRRPTVV